MKQIRGSVLLLHLWQRIRHLRSELRAANEALTRSELNLAQHRQRVAGLEAEIDRLKVAHKGALAQWQRQAAEASTHAAAEHWKAFKWGENYKIMELDLNATRTERDLAFDHARKLAARVEQLEADLAKAAR